MRSQRARVSSVLRFEQRERSCRPIRQPQDTLAVGRATKRAPLRRRRHTAISEQFSARGAKGPAELQWGI
eukprot:1403274-Prymnesium_polylepis.1